MKNNISGNNSMLIVKVIIAIGIAVSIISLYVLLSIETPQKPLAGQGTTQGMADIGGEFQLIDQDGKEFSSKELKGKLSLIYFGFTYCPDICPTSLQKLTEVIDTLDKYKIDVIPVFITIDPQRDTSELLKEYLKHFHSKYVALTGTEKQIKDVAEKFKVFYAKAREENNNNYMIDHSSFVYLMDKDGQYVKHFYFNTPPQDIIDFIRVHSQQTK